MNKKDNTFRIIADDMMDLNMIGSIITGCLDKDPNRAHILVEVKDEYKKQEIEHFLEDFFLYEDTGATYEVRVD